MDASKPYPGRQQTATNAGSALPVNDDSQVVKMSTERLNWTDMV